jgi:hypothetical protein
MKKLIAILLSAMLIMAALPVLAFTGYDEEPPMPEETYVDDPLFEVRYVRMENDPEIESTPWGETYEVWVPMGSDPAAEVGETVTYSIEYTVPDAIEGFTDEELCDIRLIVSLVGLSGLEIVGGEGLDPNYACDYEHGYCYVLPGYGNAFLENGVAVIHPHIGTSAKLIVQGVVSMPAVSASMVQSVGQVGLTAYYSVGKVETIEGGYYVFYKDIMMGQIRGMKFMAEDGLFDGYYVCLNDVDYIRSAENKGVSYTRADDPSVVVTGGASFDALERAYDEIMSFFGFTDDGIADVLTDSVFLQGSDPEVYIESTALMQEGEPEPTEPVDPEPTEPVDPEPTEPDPTEPGVPEPIAPPVTGGASLAFLGVLAAACGAAVLFMRKRED